MATLKRQKADGTWEYIQLTGKDLEKVVTSVNNIEPDVTGNVSISLPDSHSHDNKTVLDGLSDNAGKLQYNGTDIGGGDVSEHIQDPMPHTFADNSGTVVKTYKYGWKVEGGVLKFIYEEVI